MSTNTITHIKSSISQQPHLMSALSEQVGGMPSNTSAAKGLEKIANIKDFAKLNSTHTDNSTSVFYNSNTESGIKELAKEIVQEIHHGLKAGKELNSVVKTLGKSNAIQKQLSTSQGQRYAVEAIKALKQELNGKELNSIEPNGSINISSSTALSVNPYIANQLPVLGLSTELRPYRVEDFLPVKHSGVNDSFTATIDIGSVEHIQRSYFKQNTAKSGERQMARNATVYRTDSVTNATMTLELSEKAAIAARVSSFTVTALELAKQQGMTQSVLGRVINLAGYSIQDKNRELAETAQLNAIYCDILTGGCAADMNQNLIPMSSLARQYNGTVGETLQTGVVVGSQTIPIPEISRVHENQYYLAGVLSYDELVQKVQFFYNIRRQNYVAGNEYSLADTLLISRAEVNALKSKQINQLVGEADIPMAIFMAGNTAGSVQAYRDPNTTWWTLLKNMFTFFAEGTIPIELVECPFTNKLSEILSTGSIWDRNLLNPFGEQRYYRFFSRNRVANSGLAINEPNVLLIDPRYSSLYNATYPTDPSNYEIRCDISKVYSELRFTSYSNGLNFVFGVSGV